MGIQKEEFGWSKEVERFLIEHDQTIPKGTFTIQSRSGKWYWYYNLSSGHPRLIYLCSVEEKGNESSSFRNSVNVLKRKLKNPSERVSSVKLVKIIDRTINDLRKEGYSIEFGVERTKKTTQDLIYHMKTFREFVERKNLSLSDCVKVEFGNDIISYVSELKLRYKPNTVKRHLTSVKMFLNDLVQPKSGKPLIPSHPITPLFLKRNFSFRKEPISEIQNFYSEEVYNLMFNLCGQKVREVWGSYLKEGIHSVKTSDLVYFVSLLQLNYGFRIGELLDSYRSEELFRRFYSGKGGFSFIEKDEDELNYTFQIFTKNRMGMVYVDYGIFSWNPPPEDVPHRRLSSEEFKTQPFVFNVVEVMIRLFSNKTHLISLDRTSYFKLFKEVMVETEGFGKYGISTTHDLRDMCINYLIHTKGYSPTEISKLTRHSIQTMETYYLHRNKRISVESSERFKTKQRFGDVKKGLKKS